MLREIMGVRQDHPELQRRWFQDEYFDLFVWTTPAGAVLAFQLAYEREGDEHVLDWEHSRGCVHRKVETAYDGLRGIGATPLLALGGRFPKYRVLAQFDARSAGLDAPIRDVVRKRVIAYNNPRPRGRPRQRMLRAHRL